jgi:hypothetical protein
MMADVYHTLRPVSKEQAAQYYKVVVLEHFAIRDIVKYGLVTMGYAMSPELFNSAASLPFRRWAELVESIYADVDIKQAVSAGVRVLAQLDSPPEWPPPEWFRQPSPRLSSITIDLKAMSFAAAVLRNAIQLRLPYESILDDNAQSRFYSAGSERSELEEDLKRDNVQLASGLTPTTVQRCMPHHPCYDLVPWPSFRSNIISAISMDPPLIDEDELCLDVFGGGLRCWGSAYGSAHGHGQSVPWDARSWEAMPWFLEKWAVLTGGENGEVAKNSAWWRAMRGGDGDETSTWTYM